MAPQEGKIERRLAAILAADVAGYSRLMEQDEVGTLRTLTAHREIMDRLINENGGRIANKAIWCTCTQPTRERRERLLQQVGLQPDQR